MRRTKALLPVLLVGGMLAIAACGFSLPQGNSGSIALIPFWDEEQGIQGVRPLEGWSEEAELVQNAIPLSRADTMALLMAQTDLSTPPESTGRFKGKALMWELYTFETHLQDAPVGTLHVDLAVAENGTTTYAVGLAVLPDAYDTNPALFDTIFTHAVYALEPME